MNLAYSAGLLWSKNEEKYLWEEFVSCKKEAYIFEDLL